MVIDRRSFVLGSLVAVGLAPRVVAGVNGEAVSSVEFVSACRLPDGTYAVVLLSSAGDIIRQIPISARGHDIAIDRVGRRGVVFGRRPGYFAVAFDLDGRRDPDVFAPEPDRHFFGHGVFSADGRLLYTSEHNVETGEGLIGIYDATGGWKRVGEFPSYGVGPHEAILLADGVTLAIANGGFATDPSSGREAIDVSGMQPTLAFVDVRTGEIRANHAPAPDLRLLSIRHIAANAKGEVWFGGQWQGGLEQAPGLIGRASLDSPLEVLDSSSPLGVALKGYIGSVAISPDGRILAASAPRAGRIIYTDTVKGTVLCETQLGDGCGLTAVGDSEFALSSGAGVVQFEHPGHAPLAIKTFPGTEFDNHLRLVRQGV